MRKFSLVLAALLVVASGAFAQVSIEPTIEVEASATFGVQLDEMTTGISNSAESTLSFVFTEEQTEEYGEGEVYGWIELDGFKVEFDESGDDQTNSGALAVSVGSVTGKVMLGPAYISLDEATVAANEAEAFALIDQSLVSYVELENADGAIDADVGTSYDPEFPGVALGFAVPDVATVEFGVASLFDWDETDGANDDNAYSMSIDAEITAIEATTIALVSTMQFGNGGTDANPGTQDNPVGVGVSAEYALPMGEMTLSPVFGVDFTSEENANEDALTRLEFGAGAKLSWAALGLDEDGDDHIGFVGDGDDEEEVTSGAYLGAVFGIHDVNKDESINTLGVRLGVYEDSGDAGLLPVVGLAFMVDYTSTLANEDAPGTTFDNTRSDLGLGFEVDADLGVVSPYAGIKVLMLDVEGDTLENPTTNETESRGITTINLGTDINVIPNTTFTIDYASGNLSYNDEYYSGADATYGDTYGNITSSTAQLGVVTLETTVSF